MNSHHNNGGKDTSLNGDLDKLSQAYGRLDHQEPPELLDQTILNRARRAVEKKPHWMQFGWLHGLTTAAVFVLAFTIILNQRESAPGFESDVMSSKPALLKTEKAARSNTNFRADEAPARLLEERERAPDDLPALELSTRKVRLSDKDSMAKSPQADRALDQAGFMAASEPAVSEMNIRVETDSEAEQKLAAIINLKQAGDEAWKSELELFQELFPNYPLPDELKD